LEHEAGKYRFLYKKGRRIKSAGEVKTRQEVGVIQGKDNEPRIHTSLAT
jgi:hypothetical protein